MNKNKTCHQKSLIRYLLALVLAFNCLPTFARWEINEQECQCKIIPASIKHKAVRFFVVTNNPDNWNYDFVDLKTGKYLSRKNFDYKTGKYKVRDRWYQAKWIPPTKEQLELQRLWFQSPATNNRINDELEELKTRQTFLELNLMD